MKHRNSGHFAAKHPPGRQVPTNLMQAVKHRLSGKAITCETAHEIAAAEKAETREVGVTVDLLEGHIVKCQLGLFGHGPSHKKIIQASPNIAPELRQAIESRLSDGRLSCEQAWRIAADLGLARIVVANACEGLKIKINRCQLGAF